MLVGAGNLAPPPAGELAEPIAFDDYALQYYYGQLGARLLRETGVTWGYDPNFMAGYPKNPLYYPSSKLYELSLFGQSLVGRRDTARAFNLTVFALVASLPLLAFAAARIWRMPPFECIGVVAMSTVPHTLVPMAGFYSIMEAAGMIPYVFAASLSLVVVALFDRWLSTGGRATATALLLTAPLLFASHPTAAVLCVVPVACLYTARFRRTGRAGHTVAWGSVVAIVGLNSIWWTGLLLYAGHADVGDFYTEGGKDHFAPGGGWRAPFESSVPAPALLTLVPPLFGVVGLYSWWREGRRDRLLVFGPQILFLFVVSFYGVHLGLSAIGPARITLALGLYLFFPAAHGLSVLIAAAVRIARRHLRPPLRVAAGAVVAVGVAGLASQLQATRPYSLPDLETRERTTDLGRGLLRWLSLHTHDGARLLHEETDRLSHRYYGSHLPALIPLVAGVPLANGPAPHALVKSNHLRFIAGTFLGHPIARVSRPEVARHLALYNVGWVLCWSPASVRYFERHPRTERIARYDKFTLFEVAGTPSWFVRGTGQVRAAPNRIELTDVVADEGVAVLKYHWLATLRSDPPRELRPVSLLDVPVPFVSVADPPAELTIYNDAAP